jgi:hypothetical protein
MKLLNNKSLSNLENKIVLPVMQRELLDERLKSYSNSTKRTSWEVIKKNVRTKKAK